MMHDTTVVKKTINITLIFASAFTTFFRLGLIFLLPLYTLGFKFKIVVIKPQLVTSDNPFKKLGLCVEFFRSMQHSFRLNF
jgi:hypothetical protein